MPASLLQGPIRTTVLGAHTASPDTKHSFTVYRTIVAYNGECYERMLRYKEFRAFYKRLKLRNGAKMNHSFPPRTWKHSSSLQDEIVEARQVLLDEFMREVCTCQLTRRSEDDLMKLLRIGKYEDSCGRVSEICRRSSLVTKGDRKTVDVLKEVDEEEEEAAAAQKHTGLKTATLVHRSFVLTTVASNAETVSFEDDQDEEFSVHHPEEMLSEPYPVVVHSIPTDHNSSPPLPTITETKPRPSKSLRPQLGRSTSIPPSEYSEQLLKRPVLRSSQSLPLRRQKKVEFADPPHIAPMVEVRTGNVTSTSRSDSPAHKYQKQISSQLDTISQLLADMYEESEGMQQTLTRHSSALTA